MTYIFLHIQYYNIYLEFHDIENYVGKAIV